MKSETLKQALKRALTRNEPMTIIVNKRRFRAVDELTLAMGLDKGWKIYKEDMK